MPSPAETGPLTEAKMAAMAHSLYRTGPAVTRKIQHLRPYICPFDILVPILPDAGSVLDIGCGAGLFLGLAALSGKRITGVGVDLSEPAIHLANEMRRTGLETAQSERLTFRRSHGTGDWPEAQFDAVSMIDVMHHIPPDRRWEFFGAVMARVKPGGMLLYKDMCRRPLWLAFLNRCHDLVLAHEWIHYCPIREIEMAAQKAGFVAVRSEDIQRLWYGHELRVFRKKAASA